MISDDQISKILDKMTGFKEDHDLLVRISTSLEQLSKSQIDERERTLVTISRIENSVSAAHTRIDNLSKFHWMVSGAVATVAVAVTVTTFLLKLSGKI